MKKNWFLVLVLTVGFTFGQSFQATEYGVKLESLEYLNNVCPPSEKGNAMGFQGMEEISQASAERIVDQMLSDMGITNKYKVRECKDIARGNAKAEAFFDEGRIRRYIIYDVDFLKQIANSTETNYAAMFVLAHEVGHHINDHTINYNSSEVPIEIDADVFAGTQLAISGANLEQTLRAARTSKNIFTGKYATHPGRMDRMKAAFKGWMKYAQNYDSILNENASYIKEYNDEIGKYQQQLIEKNRPKSSVTNKEVEVVSKVSQEQKEQDDASNVLQKYFEALGGMASVTGIKAMSFEELTETANSEFEYHYDQRSPNLLIISNNTPDYEGEQYKISNDSLYHRFDNTKKWKKGIPSGDGNDSEEFIRRVGSSTGNFLEDFTLFSSPSLVALKEVVTFEKEQCHRLEVNEVLDNIEMDKKGNGFRSFVKQNRYYRVSDGLLHATERIRKIQDFKKNKPLGRTTLRTVTIHQNYSEVDGVKFPMKYDIILSTVLGAEEYEDQRIVKTVTNINITQKVK